MIYLLRRHCHQSLCGHPQNTQTRLEIFDFGNREDALLDDESDDGSDILGEFSKPVEHILRRPQYVDKHSYPYTVLMVIIHTEPTFFFIVF
jgi:hypothetical protein